MNLELKTTSNERANWRVYGPRHIVQAIENLCDDVETLLAEIEKWKNWYDEGAPEGLKIADLERAETDFANGHGVRGSELRRRLKGPMGG